jgi:hypothetical protein
MSIPLDLQYMIISYIPQSELKYVCKKWNKKIQKIQKDALNVIGVWYQKIYNRHSSVEEMVRFAVIYVDYLIFILIPELTVYNLRLNDGLLKILPSIKDRKRSDVRDWMNNLPLTLEEWYEVRDWTNNSISLTINEIYGVLTLDETGGVLTLDETGGVLRTLQEMLPG